MNVFDASTHQGKLYCPRCDGNGFIYKGQIAGSDNILYICMECEAVWHDPSLISMKKFYELSTILNEIGRTYKDVTNLGYYMVK